MQIVAVNNLDLSYPIIGAGNASLKNSIIAKTTGVKISGTDKVPMVNALQDINFSLESGDRLGIIGHNGAGKSTLLKVLAGIYYPTSGKIQINGKLVSTLNISLGMEQEATGRENIIIRGLLSGLTKKQILAKLDDIAEFCDLGQYLDMPLRIYSTGMATRLAFGTVTALEADVVLMDEVIGTGDAAFMEKAQARLDKFIAQAHVLVIASHSEETIRKFCNKALLLEHGKMKAIGTVDEVMDIYNAKINY